MIRAIAFDFFGVLHDSRTGGLNPRLAELIEQLRPKYQIAILSNSYASYLQEFLAAHHARHLFDVIAASHDIGYAKPDRRIFTECARMLGVDPAEMLFVDDNPGYMAAVTRYGIPAILYEDPDQFELELGHLLH